MNDGETPESFFARRDRLKAAGINGNGAGTPLTVAASSWLTPTALDRPRSEETLAKCADYRKRNANQNTVPLYLGEVAAMWPTPQSRDIKGVDRTEVERGNARPLNEVVARWPTPTTMDSVRSLASDFSTPNITLNHAIKRWPNPNATDGDKAPSCFSRGPENPSLPAAAKTWSTPSVADVTGGRTSRSGDRKDEALLNTQAKACSLPDPETAPPGPPSLPTDLTSPRLQLNPRFVEWLMGWPPGWTNFGCSETALSLWKQHSRFALSQLASHDAPPAQTSLFG